MKQAQLGVPDMQLTQWYADGFVQDDWRVTQNTTVNFGVRYEYMSALTDIRPDKPGSNLTWQDGVPYIFIGGQEGTPKGMLYTPKLKFAPRVGLTHAFQGKFPFVMRASYGIFFTPIDMNTWCNQRHNVPFEFPITQQSDPYTPSLTGFNFPSPVLGKTVTSFTGFYPHSPSQYIEQWSYSLQKAITPNTVVEIGYQGNDGYPPPARALNQQSASRSGPPPATPAYQGHQFSSRNRYSRPKRASQRLHRRQHGSAHIHHQHAGRLGTQLVRRRLGGRPPPLLPRAHFSHQCYVGQEHHQRAGLPLPHG